MPSHYLKNCFSGKLIKFQMFNCKIHVYLIDLYHFMPFVCFKYTFRLKVSCQNLEIIAMYSYMQSSCDIKPFVASILFYSLPWYKLYTYNVIKVIHRSSIKQCKRNIYSRKMCISKYAYQSISFRNVFSNKYLLFKRKDIDNSWYSNRCKTNHYQKNVEHVNKYLR